MLRIKVAGRPVNQYWCVLNIQISTVVESATAKITMAINKRRLLRRIRGVMKGRLIGV